MFLHSYTKINIYGSQDSTYLYWEIVSHKYYWECISWAAYHEEIFQDENYYIILMELYENNYNGNGMYNA